MTTMSLVGAINWVRRYSRKTLLKRLRSTARRDFFFEVTKPTRCTQKRPFRLAKTKKSRVLNLASGLEKTASKSLRDGSEITVIVRPGQADRRLRPFARRQSDDLTTAFGGHACTETMISSAFKNAWLKRTFHDSFPFRSTYEAAIISEDGLIKSAFRAGYDRFSFC